MDAPSGETDPSLLTCEFDAALFRAAIIALSGRPIVVTFMSIAVVSVLVDQLPWPPVGIAIIFPVTAILVFGLEALLLLLVWRIWSRKRLKADWRNRTIEFLGFRFVDRRFFPRFRYARRIVRFDEIDRLVSTRLPPVAVDYWILWMETPNGRVMVGPGLTNLLEFGRLLQTEVWKDQCSSCGYDLTGNTSGRCPECGVRKV